MPFRDEIGCKRCSFRAFLPAAVKRPIEEPGANLELIDTGAGVELHDAGSEHFHALKFGPGQYNPE